MAFDEARAVRSGVGGSVGGMSRGSSVTGKSLSYQNGDGSYARACGVVEEELRKLTTGVAGLRKLSDNIGTMRDNLDVRARVATALTRARDGSSAIGESLKGELATEAERADLSQKEKSSRRLQTQRYTKDYKDAMQVFQEVRKLAAFSGFHALGEMRNFIRETKRERAVATLLAIPTDFRPN